MRNLNNLLQKSKNGRLTDEQISYVVKRVEDPKVELEDLYTCIFILGMAFTTRPRGLKYRQLVESFLYYPKDPEISAIALKTLCDYWDLTADYLDVVKEFIKGVVWDKERDLVLVSVNIAGEFLRKSRKKDKELLQLLIDLWEKPDQEFYEAVYIALARAVQEDWNDLLKKEAPDPGILEKVYKLKKELCNSL